VVPLPAALLLLAALAGVFQYQLMSCVGEADKLDLDATTCSTRLATAGEQLATLRAVNAELQGAWELCFGAAPGLTRKQPPSPRSGR
jgi:hypothetical protein